MARLALHNVSVQFPVYNARGRSIKNSIARATTGGIIASDPGQVSVEALKNINLEISKGNRVALLGHNGAGKSTLLRVMAGIYEPTLGKVEIEGRITAMFDQSIGASLEATGWQNIETRGILLGLSKCQITQLKTDVANLSGLGDFLDMPVRTYSAGMRMRLAFCVSTAISPEILLLDEGIMAGDAGFMKMAKTRLDQLVQDANILVLASHSLATLRTLCDRGALLNRGSLQVFDDVDEMIDCYKEQVKKDAEKTL